MNVTRKDATITNTDDEFPGSFEVVLSTPAKDRDGDELAASDWKMPLPDHITFDTDHGMTVEKTVGSGVPTLENGEIIVRGTYSSLPRAQEARTLVKEGHIRTVSVAFMSEKVVKDGKSRSQRELLNGAFVAVPANREARVLSSKAGARNSASDQQKLQDAHAAIVAAGAMCSGAQTESEDAASQLQQEPGPQDASGALYGSSGGKGYVKITDADRDAILKYASALVTLKAKYSAEQLRAMLAKGEALKNADGDPSFPIGDKEDLSNAIHAVGRGGASHDSIRAYIIRRAKALGASDMIPENWSSEGSKTVQGVETKEPTLMSDPGQLAQAVDAALDEGWNLLEGVDQTSLPEEVQQAIGCFAAAGVVVDDLLDAMHVPNPDDEDAAAGDAAPDDSGAAAKSVDAEVLELQYRAFLMASAAE